MDSNPELGWSPAMEPADGRAPAGVSDVTGSGADDLGELQLFVVQLGAAMNAGGEPVYVVQERLTQDGRRVRHANRHGQRIPDLPDGDDGPRRAGRRRDHTTHTKALGSPTVSTVESVCSGPFSRPT